jgi:hypothetical protein
VTTAWELEISASAGGEALGTTRILARPGEIPPLRLRPARSVLAAGDEVSIQLLRGPDFSSDLPDEGDIVPILQGQRRAGELSYRSEDRSFVGTIPGGVHGLLAVSWEGARAHLWVPDPSPLVVTLGTDRTSYRPGERTTITVSTREGDSPTGAAVTLSGVDFALDEVGRLIEPDDWSRVIARGRTHQASFDRFDTLALHAGRIRGEHAVQATLQRIWWNSQENEQGRIAPIETAAPLDPQEVFERAFYGTLRDLRQAVIAWEQEAPAGARLTPAVIGILLEDTLRAREAAGLPIRDAWGLRLELRRLPTSYLELLDPYRMATDARRLSEDVESWEAWVAEEAR